MEKITLPTLKQVENLKVLKKYGIKAKKTDFNMAQVEELFFIDEYGEYWTKTPGYDIEPHSAIAWDVFYIKPSGSVSSNSARYTRGVRPVISLSEIYKSKRSLNRKTTNGIEKIEYGEYPQSVVSEQLEEKLETLYQQNKLQKTKKKYTTIYDVEKRKEFQEYEYRASKYIRVDEMPEQIGIHTFANAIEDNSCWFKVEPIEWLVDKNADIAISEKILTSIQFSNNGSPHYKSSLIKKFLEEIFIKEIIPSTTKQEMPNKNVDMDKIDDLISLMNVLKNNEEKPKQKVR